MLYLIQFVQTCAGTHLLRMGHYTSTLLRWPTLAATCAWQPIRLGHNAREWIYKYMVGGAVDMCIQNTWIFSHFPNQPQTLKSPGNFMVLIFQSLLPSLMAASMWRLQSTFRPLCPARPPASPNPLWAGWKMDEPSVLIRIRICTGWSRFSPSPFSHSWLKNQRQKFELNRHFIFTHHIPN